MVRSMFSGVAGLRAHQTRMDVIGNNIANVNTWGYKASSANFSDSIYQNTFNATNGNPTQGNLGGINPSQVGYGVGISSISKNFATSTPSETGRGLDVMLSGTGFLIVGGFNATGIANDAVAQSGLSLSRVGILKVDGNGYLTDDQGGYIYGYSCTRQATATDEAVFNNELTPIQIPMNGNEMYGLNGYKIAGDGTIVGTRIDGTNEVITMGKIGLATVENVQALESQTGYYYGMGNNVGRVTAMEQNKVTGTFMAGFLEMPNVDLAMEFSNMITAQRGFQANSKIITVTDEMLQELVNMKR